MGLAIVKSLVSSWRRCLGFQEQVGEGLQVRTVPCILPISVVQHETNPPQLQKSNVHAELKDTRRPGWPKDSSVVETSRILPKCSPSSSTNAAPLFKHWHFFSKKLWRYLIVVSRALVSDIGMPDEDGISYLPHPAGARHRIPAVALTAMARMKIALRLYGGLSDPSFLEPTNLSSDHNCR